LRTSIPSTACKMMRARSATCCGVEWVRTSCSSASRWSGVLPAVSRFAWAQTYPSRPVHVIVGFTAGNNIDICHAW
jgi:hypothetical protein